MAVNGEVVDPVDGILNSWLLDFVTYSAFAEFLHKRTVEDAVCRDLISGVLKRPLPNDTQTLDKKCITVLLCRLADGEDFLWMADSNDVYDADEVESKTTLEDGITFLEELLERHSDVDDIDEVRLKMKCEAVYVCCRVGDFDAAQEVFDRIWKMVPLTYNEKKTKKKIQAVIDSNDGKHPELQAASYSEFVDQGVRLLGVIKTKLFQTEPFLVQAAKTVLEKERKGKQQSQATGNKVKMETSSHKSSSKKHASSKKRSPIKTRSKHYTGNKNNNSTAEEQSTQSGSEAESYHSTKSIQASKENISGSPGVRTRSGHSRFTHRKPHRLDHDSSQNSDASKAPRKAERQSAVTKESGSRKRSRRLPSTESEDEFSSGSLILSSQYKPPVAGQPSFKREASTPVKEEDSVSESSPKHTSTPSHSKSMKPDTSRGRRRHSDSDSDTEDDDRHREAIRKHRYKKNIGRPNRHDETRDRHDESRDRHNESRDRHDESRDRHNESRDRHNKSRDRHGGKRDVKEVFDFVMTDGDSDFNEIDDLDKSLMDRIGGDKPKKLHMRKSYNSGFERHSPTKGSSRKKWTSEEEERLYEAIVEFGVGNWAKIKETYGFIGRTQVQLKDKWRTILKQGRHKILMTKFGRVSGIDYF